MKQGCHSKGPRQAGGREQQEPREIQQGQIQSSSPGRQEPPATTQAEVWQAEEELCRKVLGGPGSWGWARRVSWQQRDLLGHLNRSRARKATEVIIPLCSARTGPRVGTASRFGVIEGIQRGH